jgi:hypothetical protein
MKPIFLLTFVLMACHGEVKTAREAVDVANAELASVLPQMPPEALTVHVDDVGPRWRVTYIAPPESTGGPLVIEVDKTTRVARIAHMEQWPPAYS